MGLRTMPFADDALTGAVLYCSTTMRALPYMFRSVQDADDFVAIHGDVRRLTDAQREALFDEWEREQPPDQDTPHPQALRELRSRY